MAFLPISLIRAKTPTLFPLGNVVIGDVGYKHERACCVHVRVAVLSYGMLLHAMAILFHSILFLDGLDLYDTVRED